MKRSGQPLWAVGTNANHFFDAGLQSHTLWRLPGGVEYANRLVARGHQVTVVSPRGLRHLSPEHLTPYRWLRKQARGVRMFLSTPRIDWHPIDKRVELLYVPNADSEHIPDGDILFATGWQTVASVLACPARKGEKSYLLQHYEACMGPKELVDVTWRSPLHKVVVSKWLLEIGRGSVARDLAYVPNAIDHQRYQLMRPIEGRPPRVAMMFSPVPFKGSTDGLEAVAMARKRHPGLEAVFFGTDRPNLSFPVGLTTTETLRRTSSFGRSTTVHRSS